MNVLKILIKKEFTEFTSSLFQSSREGRKKKRFGKTGTILLFALIMIGAACGLFVFTGLFADSLLLISSGETDWFYFAFMGLLTLILGTLGSIFNTMAALYKAKDNEMLLSLPIEPWKILFARMTGVYFLSILFTAILWIPTSIRYWIYRDFPPASVILCILLTFVIALIVAVISCALGWVVASISGKLRNRSTVTVIISLVIFGLYYYVVLRLNSIVTSIAANMEQISTAMRAGAFPIYHLGRAAAGNVVSFLIFTVIAAVLFAICIYVLSRTFIRIITSNKGLKKIEYKEEPLKEKSVKKTLLSRELRHFTKSSTYMLNCGLGLVMLPAAVIVIAVNRGLLDSILANPTAWVREVVYVGLTAMCCLITAMNVMTAPSISIEGRNIWILQSLPVPAADILHAKIRMQVILNLIPALFAVTVIGIITKPDVLTLIMMFLTVLLFIWFDAAFGLRLNLKRPNFSWKSENIPIKQGMPVFIALFGGWGICIVPVILFFFLSRRLSAAGFLAICSAVLLIIIILQEHWIRGKGSRMFEELN